MLNAIAAKFGTALRQRCVMHKMDNVPSYIPTRQQEEIKPELRALLYQQDRQAADQAVAAFIEKYRLIYPNAVKCLQHVLEVCLTFYAFLRSIERPSGPIASGGAFWRSQTSFPKDG